MATVKLATKFDLDTLVEFMRHYALVSPIYELRHNQNEDYVRTLLWEIITARGAVWISFHGDIPTGMLVVLRNSNVWNPNVLVANELAFWVEPEYRGGLSAYRLLHAYKTWAVTEQTDGRIVAWTISRLADSEIKNYTKLGCSLLEETWIGVQ
jgi:hypothetical protein